MKVTIDFHDFKPWSGAVVVWNRIEEDDKLDTLETILDGLYPEGISDGELNDLLWFDSETVFEWLDMNDVGKDDGSEEFNSFCNHFSSCDFCPMRHEKYMKDCMSRFDGEDHEKLMACIEGQDKDNYNASILND